MKSLQLFICVSFLALRYKTSGFEIAGYERSSVLITCSHKWAERNKKYFCKDPCEVQDILIDSEKSSTGKYRLNDSGAVFTVEIFRLEKKDAGKYWCAVDRYLRDTYNEVILKVLDALPTSPPRTSSTLRSITVSSIGDMSTSNATCAPVSFSEPSSLSPSNNDKTSGCRLYLVVSVCVVLLTCVVGILAFLALNYKVGCAHHIFETLVTHASRCCSRKQEADVSDYEGDSSGKQNSVSQSHPPAATDTEADYETIFMATTKFSPRENIYIDK